MNQPRQWRKLERHPLSNEYDEIGGDAWQEFVAGVREFGVVNGRKVTLHEGKVIDGWQLHRACVETDTKPTYAELKLPRGMDVERWVEIVNDNRRHEDMDTMKARAEKRRERVAAARAEGKSLRAIAEQEDVSKSTIEKDIETITVHGGQCAPPDGKIKGKDDREQPAWKPEPRPNPPRFGNRSQAQQPLPPKKPAPMAASTLQPKAQLISEALKAACEATQQASEGSDQVIRATMEKQRKKLELVIADIDLLLDKPEPNAPMSREDRKARFDAVIKIAKASAAAVGDQAWGVVKRLCAEKPPYTVEEILDVPAAIQRHHAAPPGYQVALGSIPKFIELTRQPVEGNKNGRLSRVEAPTGKYANVGITVGAAKAPAPK